MYSAYRGSNCSSSAVSDLPVWGHVDTWIIFLPVSLSASVRPVSGEMETWNPASHTDDSVNSTLWPKKSLQLIMRWSSG